MKFIFTVHYFPSNDTMFSLMKLRFLWGPKDGVRTAFQIGGLGVGSGKTKLLCEESRYFLDSFENIDWKTLPYQEKIFNEFVQNKILPRQIIDILKDWKKQKQFYWVIQECKRKEWFILFLLFLIFIFISWV